MIKTRPLPKYAKVGRILIARVALLIRVYSDFNGSRISRKSWKFRGISGKRKSKKGIVGIEKLRYRYYVAFDDIYKV